MIQGILAGMLLIAAIMENLFYQGLGFRETRPDLILLLVVYIGLTGRIGLAMTVALGGGLLQDLVFGNPVGLNVMSKVFLGYIVGHMGARFSIEDPFRRLMIVFGATLIHWAIGTSALHWLLDGTETSGAWLPSALLNCILAPVFFYLMSRVDRAKPMETSLGPSR